jgi:hypothetical protein
MGSTGASDLVYDLVSIQYHALKGAQVYDQFLSDASGNDEVQKFIEQVKTQDQERAQKCHQLLAKLTKDGIGGDAYPTESSKQTTNA